MGVYIKGMSLKDLEIENCDSCCISFYCEFDQHIDGYSMKGGRPTSCPLVEVPEHHGRLVDADKLIEEFTWCKEQTDNYNKEHWQDIIDRVNRVKTIIDKED